MINTPLKCKGLVDQSWYRFSWMINASQKTRAFGKPFCQRVRKGDVFNLPLWFFKNWRNGFLQNSAHDDDYRCFDHVFHTFRTHQLAFFCPKNDLLNTSKHYGGIADGGPIHSIYEDLIRVVRPWYGKILKLTEHPKTIQGGSTDMGQMPESTTTNPHDEVYIGDAPYSNISNENQYTKNPQTVLVGGFNPVENISHIGSFPQVGVNIKNIWNHHLEYLISISVIYFWGNPA